MKTSNDIVIGLLYFLCNTFTVRIKTQFFTPFQEMWYPGIVGVRFNLVAWFICSALQKSNAPSIF